MNNATDFNLDAMVADWAVEIFEQAEDQDNASELAHGYADGSEWVVYYHKAHELWANCNTDLGEEFLENFGTSGLTYDGLASAIAFGEIYERLQSAICTLYDIAEEVA